MSLLIRPETASDAAAIDHVVTTAFASGPVSSGTEPFIVRALRRTDRLAVSLVAELDGAIVGHIAASLVTISSGARDWYGLGPLAVLPEVQRRGIGSQLMQRCLADLQAVGAQGCLLVGDPAYYGRFGFHAEPALVLRDVPPQYFQARSFGGPLPAGEVAFDPAFGATA
jgi:predicted N-acetyltransferase YhbS